MANKRRVGVMAAAGAAIITVATIVPSEAAPTTCPQSCYASATLSTVGDHGTRLAVPRETMVVAWAGGRADPLRSGR